MLTDEELRVYEHTCLGAVLRCNTTLDELELTPQLFPHAEERTALVAIAEIIREGQKADLISLTAALGIQQAVWVSKLLDYPGNTSYSVKMLKEDAKKRRLRMLAMMIRDSLEEKSSTDIQDIVMRELAALEDGTSRSTTLRSELLGAVEEIEERYKHRGTVGGVPTGFPQLDRWLDGLQKQEIIIVAARTGIGKSELIYSWMVQQIDRGIPIGIFSTETPKRAVVKKLLGKKAAIPFHQLRDGYIGERDFPRINDASADLFERTVFIDDTPGIRIEQLRASARHMVRKGARAIYVDHQGLVEAGSQGMSKVEKTGLVSKGLQVLARELDVPMVVVVQLARRAENGEPSLADLAWSGELEQDARTIMFLWGDRKTGERTLSVVKQTYGGLGNISLVFRPQSETYGEKTKEEP